MGCVMAWYLLLLMAFALSGCRSSDKPEDGSAVASTEAPAEGHAPEGAKADDKTHGKDHAKPVVTDKECGTVPPVASCCGDDTDECRSCRQEAMTKLLAWKEKCQDAEPTCAAPPVLSMCCKALIPSCEACNERNRRLMDGWRRRCEK